MKASLPLYFSFTLSLMVPCSTLGGTIRGLQQANDVEKDMKNVKKYIAKIKQSIDTDLADTKEENQKTAVKKSNATKRMSTSNNIDVTNKMDEKIDNTTSNVAKVVSTLSPSDIASDEISGYETIVPTMMESSADSLAMPLLVFQYYDFVCEDAIYTCGFSKPSLSEEEKPCQLLDPEQESKIQVRKEATIYKCVELITAAQAGETIFQTQCPNGKEVTHYSKYNDNSYDGKMCNEEEGCKSCKLPPAYEAPIFELSNGQKYSYPSQCDVVLTHSTSNSTGADGGMDIHARTKIIPGKTENQLGRTIISNVAIRIGNVTLEAVRDGLVFLNGKRLEIITNKDISFTGDYTISRTEVSDAIVLTISLGKEEILALTIQQQAIQIKYNRSSLPDMSGMFGTAGVDGFVSRDGRTILPSSVDMGDAWQVNTKSDPSLFKSKQEPIYPQSCILPKHLESFVSTRTATKKRSKKNKSM